MVDIICGGHRFSSIRGIIFDQDGTLAHSEAYLKTITFKRARLIDAQIPGVQDPLLSAFGLENGRLNPSGLQAVGTRQENLIAAAAYIAETGRPWLESLRIAQAAFAEVDSFMQVKADHTPVFPGILELVQGLHQTGLKLGVLSADVTVNVQAFLEKYDLADYFLVQKGTDHGPSKPDPTPFLQACELLGESPETVLMVGDADVDGQMARGAGAAGMIGVAWGWSIPPQLREVDVVIREMTAIQVME
ncbi:HAD family hydrolase [Thermosynechococcaceae cyanobacterium BACA0444]|uniref:HAD family hydrolase n=1 Tax=Pseudocalidococcus azoricus BACA0444 TaxID=2918990 RepID=A0AAE4FTU2_9CYAN|nr:HAD family hydrolase [Pseudocalidococcus azoricus]MDS3860755.1 HAD family hydrolase [Pseudocalidococcus azoricus BACA0444]